MDQSAEATGQKKDKNHRQAKLASYVLSYSCSYTKLYMTTYLFHVFPDMMKESTEKQFASNYGVILVANGVFDKQAESFYATGIQYLQFHWLKGRSY